MRDLWLYDRLSRFGFLSYRAKILVAAFIAPLLPLAVLAGDFARTASADWPTLLATLLGAVLALGLLHHLLRPVTITARTLRRYRWSREIGALPTHYADEAGALMADTAETLERLEEALVVLQYLDAPTGLPNRRKLLLDLGRWVQNHGTFAACAVRCVNAGRLRRTLGATATEEAIWDAAVRLRGRLRGDETLYRIGSAEFLFLTPDGPEDVAVRLRGILAAPGDASVMPLLHGGVALFPGDARTPEALVDRAVAALAPASDEHRVSLHVPT